MKVISLSMGQNIFDSDSAVRKRQIEYGKFFDELHLIVFTPDDVRFENQKLSDNVFLYPSKSKIRMLYIFDFLKIVRNILNNSSKVSFALTCQDPFETGIVGALVKLFYGLPLHIQIHTDLGHKYFRESSLLNRIRFMMAEFVLKYSDRVRVVSERIKKSIESFSKNIDVLPIRTELFQGETLETLEIKKPFPFTLLMVCRLEKEKNIETVFEALKKLENKDIGLCIAGDGSLKERLENLAKDLGISDRVVFSGWKNELAPYYRMADVFVSSSLYEGYGISTVEAAHFGKPLILSETGIAGTKGFKEGESAFICDAKDAEGFSKSILALYEDEDLAKRMGQSAKVTASNHLSLGEDYSERYADSVKKASVGFKKRNFISRVITFKKVLFDSFIAIRYFLCGITATLVNLLSLYFFTDVVGIWYLYSSILAFLLSLVVSFALQKFVVFKDVETDGMHYQFSKFFIAAVLGVATNTLLVFIFVEAFGVWYILSQIFAGFFIMIQNFLLYKFFIFNR